MENKRLIGSIGFVGQKSDSSFFQKCVKFFTKSKWSHTFMFTIPLFNEDTVEEASLKVQLIPFQKEYRDNPNAVYEIYGIVAPQQLIDRSVENCFKEYAGTEYGFFQLFYFVVKWFYEKIGISTKHLPNFVTKGIICSELVCDHMKASSPDLATIMEDIDQDTVAPQDLYDIIKKYPNLFYIIERKD